MKRLNLRSLLSYSLFFISYSLFTSSISAQTPSFITDRLFVESDAYLFVKDPEGIIIR